MLPTPGFHHLHLNSADPDAAIDWYVRQFPSCTKGDWAGFPALLSPNNVMVLFTKVDAPPPTAPQSAIWHFGWHVPDVRKSGLQMFAGKVSVSHAYAHVFDYGGTVEIAGLTVHPGDLIQGDLHGVQTIPREIAARVPAKALEIAQTRKELIGFCCSHDFSIAKLRERLKELES